MRTLTLSLVMVLYFQPLCYSQAYRLVYTRYQDGQKITGYGTAAAFSEGRLLTAAHNLTDGNPLVEIGGKWVKIKILKQDDENDIALIECKEAKKFTKLADETPLPGKPITINGSKRGAILTEHRGIVSKTWYKGSTKWMADMEESPGNHGFDHGDSGAPMLYDGKIVGIAVAGVPKDGDLDYGKALFLPIVVLKTFLSE